MVAAVTNRRRTDKDGRNKCRNCAEPPVAGKASCEYHLLLDREIGKRRRQDAVREPRPRAPRATGTATADIPVKVELGNDVVMDLRLKVVDGALAVEDVGNNEAQQAAAAKREWIEAERQADRAKLKADRADAEADRATERRKQAEQRRDNLIDALRALGREDLIQAAFDAAKVRARA